MFTDAEGSYLMDSLMTFSPPGIQKEYQDFKSRIETFFDDYASLSLWPCKPLQLCPPECARFGWRCCGEDMLTCTACKAYLDCHIASYLGHKLYKECVSRLVSSLGEAHKKCCPWKTTPCPKWYTALQPLSRQQALTQLEERLETLLPVVSSLPLLNTGKLQRLVSFQDTLRVCKLAQVGTGLDLQQAVLLALIGWKAEAGCGKMQLLVCDFCCRKLGTCLYKSAALSEFLDPDASCSKAMGQAMTSLPRGKKRQHQEDELDPVQEHRPWCIWVVANTSGKPGCLVYLESLLGGLDADATSGCNPASAHTFKEDVEKTINSWKDVNAAVPVSDNIL